MAVISELPPVEVPPLIVAEQTGDKRTLTLTVRALPYRPIEFSGDQRAEFTAYPGNPIRTLQIFGAEEEPTEINGFWKDRFLGDGAAYYTDSSGQMHQLLTAADLVQLCDDIRRKGQEVVVQWGVEVRRGLLRRFSRRWHNVHDAEWTMRFEWSSQNDPQVPAVLSKDTDYANAQGSLSAAVAAMQNTLATATNIAADQVASYQNQVGVINGLVQEFSDTTSNVLDTQMPITNQQQRLAGILGSISANASAMMDFIDATPAVEVAVPASPATPIEGATLSVELTNRQLRDQLRDAQATALISQFSILKQLNPNIITVFTARQNVDLREVSTSFYGTQDEWRSLMVFNGLSSSKLSSGQTVFVPQLFRPLDGSQ